MKLCVRCGGRQPPENFSVARQNRDGLSSWCRGCYAAYNRDRTEALRLARIAVNEAAGRVCAECGGAVAPTLRADAEHCSAACLRRGIGRRWFRENASEVQKLERLESKAAMPRACGECGVELPATKRADAQYCSAGCGQRAAGRAWAKANPEKVYASFMRHFALDPVGYRQRANVRSAAYRASNPGSHRATQQIRRAAKMKAGSEFIHPLVVLERDDGVCGICGGDVDPFDFHVDHIIPLSRGGSHTFDNVQASHPLCNARKASKLPWEMVA